MAPLYAPTQMETQEQGGEPLIGEEVCEHLAGQVGGASRGSGNSQGGILPFLFSLLWAMGEREGEESEEKGEESLTGSLLCPWDFPGKNTGVSFYFPPQGWICANVYPQTL